ncbi:MAG: hypothetical protein ACJAYU_004672 [Bradymonadia bacterium]|jgi:uncharacterized protein YcbX
MVVNAEGRFVTQRSHPQMQSVAVDLLDGGVCATRPDHAPLIIEPPSGTERDVVVWEDTVRALDAGDQAAAWFSDLLGEQVRLVQKAGPRPIDSQYSSGEVGFADGFPVLVLTSESVAEIAHRADTALDSRRFRPNIVISGASPFAEDRWRRIAIGDIELELVKPCTRCSMVNVVPETQQSGREPLRSLAGYRRFDSGVVVGQNAVHTGLGRIEVGQFVRILEAVE